VGDVLVMSSAEHLEGTQAVMLSVILSLPVVHWQVVSVREQPASGTAVAKQGSWKFVLVGGYAWGFGSVLRGCCGFSEGSHCSTVRCSSEPGEERERTAQLGISPRF
jgi:hypothetical protein